MDRVQRRAAKIFGVTYLVCLAIIMVAFSRFYAPYVVWGNGEATARQAMGHEPAIRCYLAGAFLHGIGTVVLLAALYVILRPVNRGMALFAACSKLIYAVFWCIAQLEVFGALQLLAGPGSLRSLGSDGLIGLAGAQFDMSRTAYNIGLVFTGLGSALFAWVFFQSRYIARALAVWGVLACLFEGICGFAYLVSPHFGSVVSPDWYELPALTFELLLSLWLLVLGFRSEEPARTEA